MSKKRITTKPDESRVYDDGPDRLGIDMGPNAESSWVFADQVDGGVVIDHSNMDGEVLLSKKHAKILGERLIEWSK